MEGSRPERKRFHHLLFKKLEASWKLNLGPLPLKKKTLRTMQENGTERFFKGVLNRSSIMPRDVRLSDIRSNVCSLLPSEKYFPNLITSNRNQIVFTIFRLIWNQTDVRLVPNQLENSKYNLISVWFNKIWKIFLCVCPPYKSNLSCGLGRDYRYEGVYAFAFLQLVTIYD